MIKCAPNVHRAISTHMATNNFNFTKARLEALPIPETGRVYCRDTKEPRLGLTITIAGSKSFHCICTVEGRSRRISLGKFPDLSIPLARQKAGEMAAEVAGGLDKLRERPFVLLYPEPISPLVFPEDVVGRMFVAADLGMPQIPGPVSQPGATSPVTLAGAVAQLIAEQKVVLNPVYNRDQDSDDDQQQSTDVAAQKIAEMFPTQLLCGGSRKYHETTPDNDGVHDVDHPR